jgi:MFS family permease
MLGLLMLAGLIGMVAGALWLVMGRIYNRARAVRVSPIGAYLIALAGYMAGTTGMVFAVGCLLDQLYRYTNPIHWVTLVVLGLGSSFGAAVGSAGGYVYLWSRTTHDPDYEPRKGQDRDE